jgi:hypothetical protein
MKKLLSILAILAVVSVNAQTTKVINYPFGAAQSFTCAASGGILAVTLSNQLVYMSAIPTLTANANFSLTAASSLKAGALVSVVVKTNGSETVTFSGSVIAPVVTGSAGKTWSQSFMYNGTTFYPCGAKIQVD